MYADIFFTSVHLAEALLQADTYLCCTMCAIRKEFPKALAIAVLRQGELVKWSSDTSVMLCKWRDKRDIFLISTNDAGGDNEVEVRRKRQLVTLATPTRLCTNGNLENGGSWGKFCQFERVNFAHSCCIHALMLPY